MTIDRDELNRMLIEGCLGEEPPEGEDEGRRQLRVRTLGLQVLRRLGLTS